MDKQELHLLLTDHAQWLLENPRAKQVSLVNTTLSGCDLGNYDLRNAIFRRTVFMGCNFRHSDLRNADFTSCYFARCDFSATKMQYATFRRAVLGGGVTLAKSNMTGTDFSHVAAMLTTSIDERGYEIKMWREPDGEIWVSAGCRSFKLDYALDHWNPDYYIPTGRAQAYTETILHLKKMLLLRGL